MDSASHMRTSSSVGSCSFWAEAWVTMQIAIAMVLGFHSCSYMLL
jgi:hypothetical protein